MVRKSAITKKKAAATSPKTSRAIKTTKPMASKPVAVHLPVVGVDGKSHGKMTFSGKLFAAKVNKQLLAQAIRVNRANRRAGTASTKTRSEVAGSTRKIYRQKGTGRARHGAIRAPIFRGGGVIFGPRPHSYRLHLPKKMRFAALAAALTDAYASEKIVVVTGLTDVKPKTKEMVKVLANLGATGKVLIIADRKADLTVRALRNIKNVDVIPAANLNAYEVMAHQKVVFMKEAAEALVKAVAA